MGNEIITCNGFFCEGCEDQTKDKIESLNVVESVFGIIGYGLGQHQCFLLKNTLQKLSSAKWKKGLKKNENV